MSTLKYMHEYADVLMIHFVGTCLLLSRDEIFFWSRSEEEFKKLLLQPVSKLRRASPVFVPAAKEQYGLDDAPYYSRISMYGTFVKACKAMSLKQVKFWLRPEPSGLMMSLLQKGDIDFLPSVEGAAQIPQLPAERVLATFRSKNFRQDQYHLHDAQELLLSTYGLTEAATASCFKIACDLSGEEMFLYSGGAEAIADVAFTPEQIRYLASQQRRTKDPGLLSYERSNYFPVLGKNKSLFLVSVQWVPPRFPSADRIGRWLYWILKPSFRCGAQGRFFIRA